MLRFLYVQCPVTNIVQMALCLAQNWIFSLFKDRHSFWKPEKPGKSQGIQLYSRKSEKIQGNGNIPLLSWRDDYGEIKVLIFYYLLVLKR